MKKTFYPWRLLVGYFMAWLLGLWALDMIDNQDLKITILLGVAGILGGLAIAYHYEATRGYQTQKDLIARIKELLAEREQLVDEIMFDLEKSKAKIEENDARIDRENAKLDIEKARLDAAKQELGDLRENIRTLLENHGRPKRTWEDTFSKIAMVRLLIANGWNVTQACAAVPIDKRTFNKYRWDEAYEALVKSEIEELQGAKFDTFLSTIPPAQRPVQRDLYTRFWFNEEH